MILAVIPARGGSRDLPGKNLRRIGGLPMIAWTVRAALDAERVDRTVVSTDDPAIAAAARAYGADVPFMRPAELARDDTPTLPVINHAVLELEAIGESISVVVTLQPTSPLRNAELIDAAIALLTSVNARSAVAVAPLSVPISVVGSVIDGRFHRAQAVRDVRRQSSPPAMRITGSIYVTSRDLLAEGHLIDEHPAALVTEGAAAIDIDDERGLRSVRRAIRSGRPA